MAEVPGMGKMGYDKAIATFSPDGRLFQVEYAREAVKLGSTCIGITFNGGAILASVGFSDALAPESNGAEKIQKIDDHIGLVSSGLIGDARTMVDRARVKCQVHTMTYDEPIDTPGLVKYIADIKQAFTQYGGARPIGVSFLVAGYNNKPYLFETDPGGGIFEWVAQAIGRGADQAREILEKGWKKGLTADQALELAVKALKKTEKDKPKDAIELAVVDGDGFRELTGKERIDALKNW